MAEDRSTEQAPAQEPPPARLLALEIGGWPPLGPKDVRLELAGRRTVLVGKNGAGKSALLEAITLGGQHAAFPEHRRTSAAESTRPEFPERFLCRLGPNSLVYSYELEDGKRTERCWRPESNEVSWELKDGLARFRDGSEFRIPSGSGILSALGPGNLGLQQWQELAALRNTLGGILQVAAGIPREQGFRTELVLGFKRTTSGGLVLGYDSGQHRLARIALDLVHAHDRNDPRLQEFIEIGRRAGAWQDVRVDLYSPRGPAKQSSRELATVSFDGVDIGLLADGTLRVAEILWVLLTGRRTLLIEEPETGIHPGLLAGLLDTIDAYSLDRQVIVSTHSPQVVSWAEPGELRLVERVEGQTRVRGLGERHVAQVMKYLHDRTLGEYVYSGALDSDEPGDSDDQGHE